MDNSPITENISDAARERELQRSESEARDILHELDKLNTLPEERKTRWVWELLQNAKDVADYGGVDITFKLTPDKLIFIHNGLPFETKHLLAILYKTSTKSLGGKEGNTGKYGTGFMTTHILSKKVEIEGIHRNASGKREFKLEIDRSITSIDEDKALSEMKSILNECFVEIDKISKAPAKDNIVVNQHSFSYSLTPSSYVYAEKGLSELEKNIPFTLLINQEHPKRINSITIERENNEEQYFASPQPTFIDGVQFISSNTEYGVLFCSSNKLIIGIPAKKTGTSYQLLPMDKQAVIFKEFPLIGTENFNLPVIIQHKDFQPTELRDGIRTKKEFDEVDDPIADKNRNSLIEFINEYLIFIEKLINANLKDIYLLAKSGLPEFVENFSNIQWYQNNIQKTIRNFLYKKSIVETCSGDLIKISQSKFLKYKSPQKESFYGLLSELIPGKIPNEDSIWQWSEIISQEPELWIEDITSLNIADMFIDDKSMLKVIPDFIHAMEVSSIEWLKKLYGYLNEFDLNTLGEEYPIYLNEANELCLRDKVAIHPSIDPEFKIVSKGLGKDLDKEFLNQKLGNIPAIKTFDLPVFYNHLNQELISKLQIESAQEEQIKAIFHICCLFRSDKALRREKWFNIINQLLPELAPEKKYIFVDYENFGRSAELWSVKYVCYLIEKDKKPTVFAQNYFGGNVENCFFLLNDFLRFIFTSQEETKDAALKRNIIPTQADIFHPYHDFIFAEQNSEYYDDSIKNIYRDYTDKGDPRNFIIDNRISFEELRRKEVDSISNEINKLFQDPNIESKVKKNGPYNEMFLQLNNWFEDHQKNAANFLPSFAEKRNSLYVIALGEGFSKQIIEIQKSGKTIEDLTELAQINLSTKEIKLFEDYASKLGTERLLTKAQEMWVAQQQIDRWKNIGNAAENAFKESIGTLDFDWDIGNPDIGKDFELIFKAKNYSIEIKSVAAGKENVRMSILQGKTAESEKERYALCVLTRPYDEKEPIDKNYFIKNSLFVTNIGEQIGDIITDWEKGLKNLESNRLIKVIMEDRKESVYINRNIWRSGISFDAFFEVLKEYFADEVNR